VKNTWHIAVVIPARDEEELLPRCLHSIFAARELLPPHVTSDVVVVADRSTDCTLRIAQDLLRHVGTAVRTNFGCVGSARALGVQVALSRYTGPIDQCWLANTDADCEVPLIWLRDQLALAEAGHAAVAGIIAHRQIFYYRAPS
jgi:glycosyltransferase involved in cell wall biosynthesis